MSVLKRFNGTTWEIIGPSVTSARFDSINDMIAPQYDSSQTYAVGNYVVQNDKLYRCKTAISVAETWTAGHWDEVYLSDGIEDLITISDTQPTSRDNRIWIDPDEEEVVIPTEDEVEDLRNSLKYKMDAITTESTLSGMTRNALFNAYTKSFDSFDSLRSLDITSGFSVGDMIHVIGRTFENGSYKSVIFLDSSNNWVEEYRGTVNQDYDEKHIIPVGTARIIINGTPTSIGAYLVEVNESVNPQELILQIPNKADKIPIYEEIEATVNSGTILNVSIFNGENYDAANARNIILTSGFTPGETVFISGRIGGNWQWGVVGFWSNSAVLSYDSSPLDSNVLRREYVIPEGTTQIRINGNIANTLPKIERITGYVDADYVNDRLDDYIEENESAQSLQNFNIINAFDRVIAKQKQAPFVFKTFDKAIISFVFDDSYADISTIESIFETNNIPAGFATIPQYLSRATLDGRTVKDVLEDVEENGGEVLCHSWTVLTSSSTDAQVYQNFVENKILLSDAGFTVNGIIMTGGDGSTTFDWKRGERYLRCYYDFSDQYGNGLGMPNYYTNNRKWLSSTDATNKAFVDTAVQNNSWIILSAHQVATGTQYDIGQSTLESIIAYVLSKDVYVLTPRQVISQFGSCQPN